MQNHVEAFQDTPFYDYVSVLILRALTDNRLY